MKITATYKGPIDSIPFGPIQISFVETKNRHILVKVTEDISLEYGDIYQFLKDWKDVSESE